MSTVAAGKMLGSSAARAYCASLTNEQIWSEFSSVEEQFPDVDAGMVPDILEVRLKLLVDSTLTTLTHPSPSKMHRARCRHRTNSDLECMDS